MNEPESEGSPRLYALRFTSRARTEVDAAHTRFEELSGLELAEEWQTGLFDAVAGLAVLPYRQLAPENARFQQEIRQLLYRRRTGSVVYRILFTVVESQEDAPYVRILHVRHGAARPITRAEAKEIESAE